MDHEFKLGKISHTDRAAFTAAYMATVTPNSAEAVGGLRCTCSERPWPHLAHVEEEAVFEYHRSIRESGLRETKPDARKRSQAVSSRSKTQGRSQPVQRQRAAGRAVR